MLGFKQGVCIAEINLRHRLGVMAEVLYFRKEVNGMESGSTRSSEPDGPQRSTTMARIAQKVNPFRCHQKM